MHIRVLGPIEVTSGSGEIRLAGQRQRALLAALVLDHGKVVPVASEPSSGLDAEAEHEIHTRLTRMRADRTSLLISHRLGSVRDAAVIFVLSDGRVTERGTHQELMASGGEYRRLFELQAGGYQADDAAAARERVRAGLRDALRGRAG